MPSAFRRKRASASGLSSLPESPSSSSSSSSSSRNTNTTYRTTSSASSFRPPRGVKPWQGGTYLTSVGLNDLDTILGGGQLLGSSILLEEDRLWTRDLALTLVKYWCAEAISQGQHLVVPTFSKSATPQDGDDDSSLSSLFGDDWSEDEEQQPWRNLRDELHDLLLALPRNLHWDKQKKKQEKAKREQEAAVESTDAGADTLTSALGSMGGLGPMAILEEGEEDEDDQKSSDDGLEVAWQYKKSVQQERLAKSKSNAATAAVVTDVFCHSYDLSARMKDQQSPPLDTSSYICELPSTTTKSPSATTECSHTNGYTLFSDLVRLLKERSSSNNNEDDTKAIRLLLYHPPMETLAIALPLLLAHIRKHELPVVVMITHAPTADVKSKFRLGRSCDVVLSTEGFAARKVYPPPAEFRHLLGILKIEKTTRKRTEIAASIYGFKRDRRKLHIPLLHIPPEDYAEGGGSVGGGGVRSGAGKQTEGGGSGVPMRKPSGGGMGCSSNMSGSLLDF